MRDHSYVGRFVDTVDVGLRRYMQQIYTHMGVGLALTGIVSFLVSKSATLMTLLFLSPLRWLVLLAPLGMVLFISARLTSLSFKAAQRAFWGYAATVGLSLSYIFLVYTQETISLVFFATASVFFAMSLYGYATQKDLTSWRSFLVMGLMGLIITSLLNLFFQSSPVQLGLSILSVLIFSGLTAYDVQELKHLYYELDSAETSAKKAVWGALRLYLDFINIFVSLLNILGERRS